MTFEQEMKASREDSSGRIWQCFSELDEIGEENRGRGDYVSALAHAFFWLGRVSGLDEGYELYKNIEIEHLTEDLLNAYDAKAESIDMLAEEEEVNPISEKAKALAMRIDRYNEQIKKSTQRIRAIKREIKRGL